jgi:phospholipid transport system substrate-binding protein|tara:strand:- start:552 stop:1151 length:600 start_codon:yes stop_codon:yes gene_type:complete
MSKLINSLVFFIIILFSTNSFSYNSDPKIFINELLNDAVKTLSDKNISKADKKIKVETIALENVDVSALSMYTLGEIRKTLDQETLRKYKGLFEKYFLKSLTSRLTDYSTQKFEILSADQKSETYTIVKSKIVASTSQPEIKIDWRVYTKNPDKPLIRDLIVEGLSLAKTQKEEFSSILNSNNNDINILFSKLEEFIEN